MTLHEEKGFCKSEPPMLRLPIFRSLMKVCPGRGGRDACGVSHAIRAVARRDDARCRPWQGPTSFPEYNAAGYNTSTYAYPQYEHNDAYYNELQDIEIRACSPLSPSPRPLHPPCSLPPPALPACLAVTV